MNRLSRITATLIQLQSRRVVTAKEIAERFDVSLRTVYRDIKTLQDAGVPIGSENGLGYFMAEGYRLPPIALTEEEANTLIVAEEFIKKQGDRSLSKNYQSLIIKIKATLKNFQKDNLDLLTSRTFNLSKSAVNESDWLSEVQRSISNGKMLDISYKSIYKEEMSQRTIEPLAVYFTNNSWVAIAYCHLRTDLREFRLDRISSLRVSNEAFKEKCDFDLEEYFKHSQP